ncbi:GumC family protein [Dongia soli]|uniref:Polysaccharide chain length determinant protein (PEP-CTERM system associated) n=1 Tax=Dongia soli TaxID=600628 RepID=A0ABU5EGT7_9PROT|nr:hypothetical protein [Dongia soli]MDY0885643.1 hypothetical protein [Dongia soli]
MTDIPSDDVPVFNDYFAIFTRRKYRMLLVGIGVFGLAILTVILWPATYRSSATILIEEPDAADEFFKSNPGNFADEQLQAIQQRVLTTQTLITVINKLNLYSDMRLSQPLDLIVDMMRTKIHMDVVSADAIDAKSGRAARAAIAFTLSFDGSSPEMAQQVTSELVNLYLAENQRSRDEQAAATAGFFSGQSRRLQLNMQRLGSALGKFKEDHAGFLPDDQVANMQLLDRTQSQVLELTQQVRALRDRQGLLQSQLSLTDPVAQIRVVDPSLMSPDTQLAMLRSQYAQASARYGTQHPDVVAMKRQIDNLVAAGVSDGGNADVLATQLQQLETQRDAAMQRYGAKHPDVVKLNRQIQATKSRMNTSGRSGRLPSNPVYLQTQTQIASIGSEINAVEQQLRDAQAKSAEIEDRLIKSRALERDYDALKRDYDASVTQYMEVKSKEDEAEIARNLEAEQMVTKLSLIEPPLKPVAPIKPDRVLLLAAGLLMAVVAGIGFGIVSDIMAGRVNGSRQLTRLAGGAPFAVVPVIYSKADRRHSRMTTLSSFVLVVVTFAVILSYLDLFVAPLNIIWANIMGWLGIF